MKHTLPFLSLFVLRALLPYLPYLYFLLPPLLDKFPPQEQKRSSILLQLPSVQRPWLHTHNSFSPTSSCLLTTEAHKHGFTLDLNFTCEDLHIPTCTLKFRCDLSYFSGRCMEHQSPAEILQARIKHFLIRYSRVSISARPDRACTHTLHRWAYHCWEEDTGKHDALFRCSPAVIEACFPGDWARLNA